MDIEIKTWLFDIKESIAEIETFLADKPRRFEDFKADRLTRRAVERNIEIIGEAMSRILKKDPAIHIENARKLVDVRNRIIHGYDSVSVEIIWAIVIKHLPLLKTEVEILLVAV